MPQRLCIRCEHKDGCAAVGGHEGASTAEVGFFNHAMLDAALEHAGSSGLLILDECPPLFAHATITLDDLETTERMLRSYVFPAALAKPCLPLLLLVLAAAEHVDDGDALDAIPASAVSAFSTDDALSRELLLGACHLGQFDADELDSFDKATAVTPPPPSPDLAAYAVALFCAALRQWPNHVVPPVRRTVSREFAAGKPSSASDIAVASRTLAVLGCVLLSRPDAARSRWSVADDKVTLEATYEEPGLAAALRRRGPTVILDGTVDERALVAVARRRVDVVRMRVEDGAPVTRVLLTNSRGAKSRLAPRNRISWETFGSALADGLTRVGPASRRILVATHKACADALRATLGTTVPHARLRQVLQTLKNRGGQVVIGHYGHLKGRNEFDGVPWQELDAVVTVGDPWPDLASVRRENALLGLCLDDGDDRLLRLAAAELGQAHGRLRAPRQTKATVAVHVGAVVPDGWTADNALIEGGVDGRRPNVGAMTPVELRVFVGLAGSGRALAESMGVNEATVRRYLRGTRAIPEDFAVKARRLFGDGGSACDAGGV